MFLCCFGVVHLVKLAKIGKDSLKPKDEPEPETKPEKKSRANKPQPVYYIVEKKQARKSSYSQPREITFTDGKGK